MSKQETHTSLRSERTPRAASEQTSLCLQRTQTSQLSQMLQEGGGESEAEGEEGKRGRGGRRGEGNRQKAGGMRKRDERPEGPQKTEARGA